MKDSQLNAHNARCREWADKQPAKYRDALLCFAYRADKRTLSFSYTLDKIELLARPFPYHVSRKTLVRHLKVFELEGLITVERNATKTRRFANVYTLDMSRVIGEAPKVPNEPVSSRLPKRIGPVVAEQYPIVPDEFESPEEYARWLAWQEGKPMPLTR